MFSRNLFITYIKYSFTRIDFSVILFIILFLCVESEVSELEVDS